MRSKKIQLVKVEEGISEKKLNILSANLENLEIRKKVV